MATEKEIRQAGTSEAQIAVHWREEEYLYPPAKFIGQANASDPAIYERFSEEQFPECFKEYADLLSWDTYWHTTLDTSEARRSGSGSSGGSSTPATTASTGTWPRSANKAAFIWVPEPESEATQSRSPTGSCTGG